MVTAILTSLGLFTPSSAESDPEFRHEIERATQRGLRAAATIGIIGPLFALAAQVLVRSRVSFEWALDGNPDTFSLWIQLLAVASSAFLLLISFTRLGACYGRLLLAVDFVLVANAIPLDWLALGEHHPTGFGVQAVSMFLAVGTMPFRAWQTAILGVAMTVTFMIAVLIAPQLYGNNPAVIFPDFPVFMLVMTVACCGVSALIYRSRFDLFRGRRKEQDLRAKIAESEQKYRSVFENSSDGIFVYSDAEGGFIMTNSVLREIVGMTEEELRHTHFTKVIHPDDRERIVKIHMARLRGEPAPNHYTLRVVNAKSSEPVHCDMTIHRTDDIRYTTGAVRDITEHVRMEEEIQRLAQLPETNPFPVLRFDRDGKLLYLNPAARRYPSDLGHPDLYITDFLPLDFKDFIRRLIETNTTVIDGRMEVREHVFSVTYRPLPESHQIYVWLVDVTERIRAEDRVRAYAEELEVANQELRDAQSQLVQSEKMAALGALVAGVAHEINTPLGSIHANADVSRRALGIVKDSLGEANEYVSSSKSGRFLRALHILEDSNNTTLTATDRIVGIVRSLRNFARLDEAELKSVNIHDGLESTLTLVYHEYKNRIKVVRDYGTLPPITCFPNQMNQVFMNLIVNAIHATPKEGTITIVTRAQDQHYTVTIADTGIGIPDDLLPRIFDPGFTTKGVGVGTGLGLSIVYKIVQAHGGRIDVESTAGEGTKFTITCPVVVPGQNT